MAQSSATTRLLIIWSTSAEILKLPRKSPSCIIAHWIMNFHRNKQGSFTRFYARTSSAAVRQRGLRCRHRAKYIYIYMLCLSPQGSGWWMIFSLDLKTDCITFDRTCNGWFCFFLLFFLLFSISSCDGGWCGKHRLLRVCTLQACPSTCRWHFLCLHNRSESVLCAIRSNRFCFQFSNRTNENASVYIRIGFSIATNCFFFCSSIHDILAYVVAVATSGVKHLCILWTIRCMNFVHVTYGCCSRARHTVHCAAHPTTNY